MCEFHNFWLRSLELGVQSDLGDYCFELQAARAEQVRNLGSNSRSISPTTSMPANTRNSCGDSPKRFGIKRVEGKIKEVKQNGESGFIESLVLQSGTVDRRRPFHRLHRLPWPADRADAQDRVRGLVTLVALRQCGCRADRTRWHPPRPTHNRSRTMQAGAGAFRCNIGSVTVWYSAVSTLPMTRPRKSLLQAIDGKPLTSPRVLKFQTGRTAQGLEQELRRARPGERIHRTARIHQHPPDDGRRYAPHAPVPIQRRRRTR